MPHYWLVVVLVNLILGSEGSQDVRIQLSKTQEDLLREVFNVHVEDLKLEFSEEAESSSQWMGSRRAITPYDLATSNLPTGIAQEATLEDLMATLGEQGIEVERPSAHFLLDLFERLQRGEPLSEAAGGTASSALEEADTIRSFTPSGKFDFSRIITEIWHRSRGCVCVVSPSNLIHVLALFQKLLMF